MMIAWKSSCTSKENSLLPSEEKGGREESVYSRLKEAKTMVGKKERHFAPLVNISLEELVPADHFYRHLRDQPTSHSSCNSLS
jgi:hypothetical protein